MQHTPGPWRISKIGLNVEDESGKTIAVCNAHYNNVHAETLQKEQQANAQAISAVPNLIDALQEAIYWDGYDDEGEPAVWLSKARRAVAKAKGEEQ